MRHGAIGCRRAARWGTCRTILETLETVEPRDKNAMGPLLHDIASQVRRRGLFFLISDCFDEVESLLGGLQHLRFGGHEVIVFHILHPDEMDFPFNGMVKFDAHGRKDAPDDAAATDSARLFADAARNTWTRLQKGCERNRCDYCVDEHRPAAGGVADGIFGPAAADAGCVVPLAVSRSHGACER